MLLIRFFVKLFLFSIGFWTCLNLGVLTMLIVIFIWTASRSVQSFRKVA
jgi:hypothetical protein